jgi:uncharacterized protein (TIRG00374 family)
MSQTCAQSPLAPKAGSWRGTVLVSLFVMLIAGCYGGWHAWTEDRQRTVVMDVDGWGAMTYRLKTSGAGFTSLFSDPPLWKGPIVPFIFALCYYIAPFDESILIFNVLAFALAAGCFVIGFCSFGVSRRAAVLAVLLGVCYWPHHMIFGYYFAEPLLALLVAILLLLVRWTVSSNYLTPALLSGGAAGVLVLARAPFLLAVGTIPVLLWYHSATREQRARRVVWFALGLVAVLTPWPVRNYLTYGEFIPFTTEGGKILFQGTYPPGDSANMNEMRQIPEYVELEKAEEKDPIKQYRYWSDLAVRQVYQDPVSQLRLCVRKALRFWVHLAPHSWTPSWKTGLMALCCLPFGIAGVVLGRRSLLVQLCVLWVGGLWAFHALVHCELRYNYPILPLAFLLVLIGIQQLSARFLPGWLPFRPRPTCVFSRRQVLNLGKYLLAFGLLGWVVYKNWSPPNGQGLEYVWQRQVQGGQAIHGGFLLGAFLAYCCAVLLTVLRWYVLVRAQGLPFRRRDALRLGLIGHFFSTFLPGSVGGDIVKAAALAQGQSRRTVAVATVIMDRLIALWGLFWFVSLLGAVFWLNGDLEGDGGAQSKLIVLIASAVLGASVAVWLLLGLLSPHGADRFALRLERLPKVGGSAAEFWRATWMYRCRQREVVLALAISWVGFVGFVLTYYFAVRAVWGADGNTPIPTLAQHFLIVPIGLVIMAVPIFPGGAGIGELGFGGLYAWFRCSEANGILGSLVQRVLAWVIGLVGYGVYLLTPARLHATCQPAESSQGLKVAEVLTNGKPSKRSHLEPLAAQ